MSRFLLSVFIFCVAGPVRSETSIVASTAATSCDAVVLRLSQESTLPYDEKPRKVLYNLRFGGLGQEFSSFGFHDAKYFVALNTQHYGKLFGILTFTGQDKQPFFIELDGRRFGNKFEVSQSPPGEYLKQTLELATSEAFTNEAASNEDIGEVQIFDRLDQVVMAKVRQSLIAGSDTGISGVVREGAQDFFLLGQVLSVAGNGSFQIVDVAGADIRTIDPRKLVLSAPEEMETAGKNIPIGAHLETKLSFVSLLRLYLEKMQRNEVPVAIQYLPKAGPRVGLPVWLPSGVIKSLESDTVVVEIADVPAYHRFVEGENLDTAPWTLKEIWQRGARFVRGGYPQKENPLNTMVIPIGDIANVNGPRVQFGDTDEDE